MLKGVKLDLDEFREILLNHAHADLQCFDCSEPLFHAQETLDALETWLCYYIKVKAYVKGEVEKNDMECKDEKISNDR